MAGAQQAGKKGGRGRGGAGTGGMVLVTTAVVTKLPR